MVFTSICVGQDANMAPAAVAAIGVGVVSGLINGFGVVKLRISPIVMTLAMNNIMLGATLVYTGGTPSGSTSPFIRALATGSFAGVPCDGDRLGRHHHHRDRGDPLFALGPPPACGRRKPACQLSSAASAMTAW